MSIAVSVAVVPSRLLRFLTVGMSGLLVVVGVLLFLGLVGNLSEGVRVGGALFSFFPALFGFYHTVQNRKVLHIDISSIGQIRISEIDVATSCQAQKTPYVDCQGKVVRLSPHSTIWPHVLLLRLRADNGDILVVPILPGCVSRDGFRALSVACRWIAAHNTSAGHKDS